MALLDIGYPVGVGFEVCDNAAILLIHSGVVTPGKTLYLGTGTGEALGAE